MPGLKADLLPGGSKVPQTMSAESLKVPADSRAQARHGEGSREAPVLSEDESRSRVPDGSIRRVAGRPVIRKSGGPPGGMGPSCWGFWVCVSSGLPGVLHLANQELVHTVSAQAGGGCVRPHLAL